MDQETSQDRSVAPVPAPVQRRPWQRWIRLRVVLALWATIVAVYFLWQTLTYRGLIALAAEWEFDAFGRYYPTLTYVLLVAIVGSPVLYLLRGRRSREPDLDLPIRGDGEARLPGRTFIRVLLGVGGGCWIAMLVVLAALSTLPGDQGAVQRVMVGDPAATDPVPGPTRLVGDVMERQVAGFDENIAVTERSIRYAPLLSPGGRDEPIRFFAEVSNAQALVTARRNGALEGVLRRGGLPGELIRLYRYAGYDIADPYYVLFASAESLRWPYIVAAAQLLLAGLICALVALGLHGRRERLRRRLDKEDAVEPVV